MRFGSHILGEDGQMTSTDGLRTIVAPRTQGKKINQDRQRKINAKTTTIKKKTRGLNKEAICIHSSSYAVDCVGYHVIFLRGGNDMRGYRMLVLYCNWFFK